MATPREGVNPLRPYYVPPTIGEHIDITSTPASSAARPGNPSAAGGYGGGAAARGGQYANKARDMFPDLDDWNNMAGESTSAIRKVKDVVDELLWKYTSVLMAQPFEVAKTILQVRLQDDVGTLGSSASTARPKLTSPRSSTYDHYADSDSDPDEPAYFTSNVPSTPTPGHMRHRVRRTPSTSTDSPSQPSGPSLKPHQISLRRPDSVIDVISQLWQKEGAWGVWKGSNATFIYTVLQSLLENWSRSLLSAVFNVPDVGLSEDIDRLVGVAAPYPWASLFVAAAAAVATGLVLAPLDLVRTRLIITPTTHRPRRTLSTLRALPSYIVPPTLFLPTILHSLLHPILTLSTPLVLRTRFMIDRDISPTAFSVAKFVSSSIALLVKLPLETILRRGQVHVLSSPEYLRALEGISSRKRASAALEDPAPALEAVVPLGGYNGLVGTVYSITSEEGSRAVSSNPKSSALARKGKAKVAETVYKRGQGLDGLWRGWKVSWWGLVGLWAAGVVGGGGDGEF